MSRLLVAIAAAAIAASYPASVATALPPPVPSDRVDYSSLVSSGDERDLNVCQVAFIHGLATVIPVATGGLLTGVVANIGAPTAQSAADSVATFTLSTYTPPADLTDAIAAGPTLATAVVPFTALSPTVTPTRIDFSQPVVVRPGQQLLLALRAFEVNPSGLGPTCFLARTTSAPTTTLYGFQLGAWVPLMGANEQLQVATYIVGADGSRG